MDLRLTDASAWNNNSRLRQTGLFELWEFFGEVTSMAYEIDKNIVDLTGFRTGMKFPALNSMQAYWEGLRAGRLVPMRSEVDPRGIESALEFAFILERIAPGMARFRLSGQHLSELMGMEVRGMPFTSFFAPDTRKEASEAFEAVCKGPEIAEISLSAMTGIGKPDLQGKILLLPLKSDLGDITRVLGCLVTEGEIGRGPRRFSVTECKMTRITGGNSTPAAVQETFGTAEVELAKITSPTVPGFEEAKANFTPRAKNGRPNLRLITFED